MPPHVGARRQHQREPIAKRESLAHAVPAGRYRDTPAGGTTERALALTTRPDSSAMLERKPASNDDRSGLGMRQVRIRQERQPVDDRWRRMREQVLPLDPRDPDVVRPKNLERRKQHP